MKLESLIWGDKIKELQLKQNLHSGITIFLWCVCKKKNPQCAQQADLMFLKCESQLQ